jgi:hypothetical protein
MTACAVGGEESDAAPLPSVRGSLPETPRSAPTITVLRRTDTPAPTPTPEHAAFSFRETLFGSASPVALWIDAIESDSGQVVLNGLAPGNPNGPFVVDWGDGTRDESWFPMSHTYADRGKNYIAAVTVKYSSGETYSAECLIRFAPLEIKKIPLPGNLAVSIPDSRQDLTARVYPAPANLSYFDDGLMAGGVISRDDIEYVLSLSAYLQYDFANEDVFSAEDGFPQVVLLSPGLEGMYSLWFTTPASFVSGEYGFRGMIQYSSFFHEMGHNVTLNSPAEYYYGGKIDGNANAIFSETMANIFAHATSQEILSDPAAYGLDEGLAFEIGQSAVSSLMVTRNAYEAYLGGGKPFRSWNDPGTPEDETFGTFMTIAFKFCEHAEDRGLGYREPLKRMMELLQHFNVDWRSRYAQRMNTPEADAFRSTLMVAALSYAFSADLRGEFRGLNFPIDNSAYQELIGSVSP